MTEPDIIRIDGVEYELDAEPCAKVKNDDPAYPRLFLRLQKKRVQTGWICNHPRRCFSSACIRVYDRYAGDESRPDRCPVQCFEGSDWQPFYGKVVE